MEDHIHRPVVVVQPSMASLIALIVACAVILYVGYRKLLPKPIVGIPYNKPAASSIFGDMPEIMSYIGRHQELWPWMGEQSAKHQSPIVQVCELASDRLQPLAALTYNPNSWPTIQEALDHCRLSSQAFRAQIPCPNLL
jgi:hypothetical protein